MVHKLNSMILAAVVMIGLGSTAQAGVLLVAGSPGYDPATSTGLKDGDATILEGGPTLGVNNSGTAVGSAHMYSDGVDMGLRPVRWGWDASGIIVPTELDNLGTTSGTTGTTNALAYAINTIGTAVGFAQKYEGGVDEGNRAVLWDASGTAATELEMGTLGIGIDGKAYAVARAVNNAGIIVGRSTKYDGSGVDMGYRAVRWNATGTIATELGTLGTDINGFVTTAEAIAVNSAGMAVGVATLYEGGASMGIRGVRWDASGTATNIGSLGGSQTRAIAINDTGTAAGFAQKGSKGYRAVRWGASSINPTELGNLGTTSGTTGTTFAFAYAINAAGTVVGYANKYVSSFPANILKGTRAVRWDGSSTTAIELANLGTTSGGTGTTDARAYAVNDANTAVGYAQKYVDGVDKGTRAVIWLQDTSVIDLNDLGVAPVAETGTWILTIAKAISADGWVSGSGTFDPDGADPLADYVRHWVAQVGLGGAWTKGDGTWGRGPNWSTGTPAMQVGNATFNLSAAYAVALDRDERTKAVAIDAGTVAINSNGHTLTAESGLSIAVGATLKADGTIIGDIVNDGTLAPGASVGTLSVGTIAAPGSVTMKANSTYEWEFKGTGDTVAIKGNLTFDGPWTLKLVDLGGTPTPGVQYNLFTFTGSCSGFVPGDIDDTGVSWDTEGAEVVLGEGRVYMIIPEPATLGLLAFGALAALRRRRS
jgi:hypothetical protein